MDENLRKIQIEYLKKAKDSSVYFSVAKYFRHLESILGIKQTDHWTNWRKGYRGCGLLATDLCVKRDLPVGSEPHDEFGRINNYPEQILAEVIFSKAYPELFP